MYEKGRRHP
jgi:chitinase